MMGYFVPQYNVREMTAGKRVSVLFVLLNFSMSNSWNSWSTTHNTPFIFKPIFTWSWIKKLQIDSFTQKKHVHLNSYKCHKSSITQFISWLSLRWFAPQTCFTSETECHCSHTSLNKLTKQAKTSDLVVFEFCTHPQHDPPFCCLSRSCFCEHAQP